MRDRYGAGRSKLVRYALALIALGPVPGAAAGGARADGALARYEQARARLAAGDLAQFRRLESRLRSFPLYPYLEYASLRKDLSSASPGAVEAFLKRYPGLPITPLLRGAWLRELGGRADWKDFLAADNGTAGGVTVRCYRVQALAAAGRSEAARAAARRLWLVGYRQPASCDSAFATLRKDGALPRTLVERRQVLAIEAGHPGLAQYLVSLLPSGARAAARNRVALYRDAGLALRLSPVALGGRRVAQRVLTAAFIHAAQRDPVAAHALWSRLIARWHPDAAVRARVEGAIALQAAYHEVPQAERWLARLPRAAGNEVVRAWRVRNALRAGDWRAVVKAVRAMPSAQRARPVWLYWEGRALDALGRAAPARALYRRAAAHFDYYGFLAADAVGAPYYWGDAIPAPDPGLQGDVRARPGAVRALLLEQAGQNGDAEREWRALLAGLKPRARLAAARVAYRAGWAWAALRAAAAAGVNNASALLFPVAFRPAVQRSARRTGVPLPWILATIRRESAFKPTVCSDAGACGLMQLVPATAHWLHRSRAVKAPAGGLDEPLRNIALGSAYLQYLNGRFGSLVIGSAAYNAGPGRVADWVSGDPPAGSARWIETLPYGETRDYLQAVLFNQAVYELRLTGQVTRLDTLLRKNRYAAALSASRE